MSNNKMSLLKNEKPNLFIYFNSYGNTSCTVEFSQMDVHEMEL